MEFISNHEIRLGRELSELDKFAIEFIKLLRKHTRYVIISGYVAILFGRSRASEDIDIIVPKIPFEKFNALLSELKQNGYYCLNADDAKECYEMLQDKLAIRLAKEGTVVPNIEMKFARNRIDEISLANTIKVAIGTEELIISHLELQVAFKEAVLKSPKDLEDARHIRSVAKEHLDFDMIKKYSVMLNAL